MVDSFVVIVTQKKVLFTRYSSGILSMGKIVYMSISQVSKASFSSFSETIYLTLSNNIDQKQHGNGVYV